MRVISRDLIRSSSSIFVLGLLGCASMNSTPNWVNGELPPEYPKEKFVRALGTGESLEAAQIAAKSELSRIFSAELSSEIELIEQEFVVGDQSTQGSEMLINTKISTDVELQGVEVPLHWRDPATAEVWAFAVLERRKECLRIRNEGTNLMTRLDAMSVDSQNQSNPLLAVRAAANAVRVGVELDAMQARSRVLGSQCLTPRSMSTGALKAQLDTGLRRLSFVITTQDEDPLTGKSNGPLPQLRERIASNLTKLGFQVGPARGADVIPVVARLRLRRVQRGTEWIEYRWEGSAEIGSPVPGAAAIIAAESEGTESHPENSTARLRARHKGELDLSKQLDTRLKAFLAEAPNE